MRLTKKETPVELYNGIYVKREDLACVPPGPPFSKVRGLEAHLKALKAGGVKIVGYMDTAVSMGGWGVSYFAKCLGLKAVIFYPKYTDGFRYNQGKYIVIWKDLGAEAIPIERPQRQKVNFYIARKKLLEKYPDAYMLEQGLPLEESIEETAKQVKMIDKDCLDGTIVVNIGSGVTCAGIIRGLRKRDLDPKICGVTAAPKDARTMLNYIRRRSGINYSRLNIIDAGYEYTQMESMKCPFPCNFYYDRKAWSWLIKNKESLNDPILFWNIGA